MTLSPTLEINRISLCGWSGADLYAYYCKGHVEPQEFLAALATSPEREPDDGSFEEKHVEHVYLAFLMCNCPDNEGPHQHLCQRHGPGRGHFKATAIFGEMAGRFIEDQMP